MPPLPFEIVDDRGARVGAHWYRVVVLIAAIVLAAGVAWWVDIDPLALIADEGYFNPFSLMLGLAVGAILWEVGRAVVTGRSMRRDGAAALVVEAGSDLRQGGRLVGEVRLGVGALAALGGQLPKIELVCEDVYAVRHVGELHRDPRLIPIESARVAGGDIARRGAGHYAFSLALPRGLKPIANFIERDDNASDGAGHSGAGFVTVPFMKPRLVGGEKRKPAFRRWRVEVLGEEPLAAFDLSEHVDVTS
jgi:hypothetical protein